MLTFALFVWFTVKFVWPPLTKAMAERQKRIADGIAAGERGQYDLKLTQQKIVLQLRAAKQQAHALLEQAQAQADRIIDNARSEAKQINAHLLAQGQEDIAQQVAFAKAELQKEFVTLVIASAEKIVGSHLDATAHQALLDQFVHDIQTK